MKEHNYKIREGEYWWLGVCAEGTRMPICADTEYSFDLLSDNSGNQTTTALLSSKGRYIYCTDGFKLNVSGGEITVATKSEVFYGEGFKNLKGAYLELSNRFYKSDGKIPPLEFFGKPQFNTWIEYTYYLTEEKILKYADDIVNSGINYGVLMIDCGWSTYYGSFDFTKHFKNPKKMIEKLHDLGFKVMLWVCPFITSDTIEFRYLRANDMLVKNSDGTVAIRNWWDGYSAVLDMTNPKACNWLSEKLDHLINEYGVDGFKFDAGDHFYYLDDDITYGGGTAMDSSRAWAEFGLKYPFNEYRSSSNMGGKPLVQRLKDKRHTYDIYGLAALVPSTLMQNLFGYYFTCPDMIGGGEYTNFGCQTHIDEELIIRYCQCSALMPMMQFSIAPWRILSSKNYAYILEAVKLHEKLAGYYRQLIEKNRTFSEPIIRLMEYDYPNSGFEKIINQFMIGNKYLCAPVIEKTITEKEIILPVGKWEYNGKIYNGGKVKIPVDITTIPIFEKV